jgi:hypothetical protein
MERLAFRIYDPALKEFHFSGSTPMMLAGYFKDTATLVTVQGMEHEQFTGLKDTEDSEEDIYEGDKVRLYGGEYCQGCWEHDETVVIKDLTYDCFMMGESENIEILGNIYENPELLETEAK